MAPPPPATLPLQQRLLQLVQTLQFAWFVGHVTLLLCAVRYALSYITFHYYTKWARFSYRTAFIAAAATYGIVVFKSFRARARSGKPHGGVPTIVGDENVQYLAMALVWLFSRQIPLAILPFAVYSVFHIATYTRSNLLPTLQPQPQAAPGAQKQTSALADTIGNFVKTYYDSSMTLVAILELALWFRILVSAILFQRGSWILIVVYTAFVRARFAQSTFVQQAINQLAARGDAIANRQDLPPAVRQAWGTIKAGIKQAADVTDVGRYSGQQGAAPKKTQ